MTPAVARQARSRRSAVLEGSTLGFVAGRTGDEESGDQSRGRRTHFHWILAGNKKENQMYLTMSNIIFTFATIVANKYGYSPHVASGEWVGQR